MTDGDEFAMPQEGAGPVEPDDDEFAMPAVPRAVRLTFTVQGEEVRLVARQPVEMVVPPTDPVSGREAESGAWVELRTEAEATLYRKVLPDPLRRDVEVFSPDPAQSVAREPVEAAAGIFSVVVPELAEADHVSLLSSAGPAARARAPEAVADEAAPAAEVARFSLRAEGGGR